VPLLVTFTPAQPSQPFLAVTHTLWAARSRPNPSKVTQKQHAKTHTSVARAADDDVETTGEVHGDAVVAVMCVVVLSWRAAECAEFSQGAAD
jgi:hypothetical protein